MSAEYNYGGGIFSDWIWWCRCDDKKPALRLQSKTNENYKKWFYTCEKPRSERCGFWAWEEELAQLLNNSSTEPSSTMPPTLPSGQSGAQITPESSAERRPPSSMNSETVQTPNTLSKSSGKAVWSFVPGSGFLTPGATVRKDGLGMYSQEIPRKTAKINTFFTKRKRSLEEMADEDTGAARQPNSPGTVMQDDDLYINAADTPTPVRFRNINPSGHSDSVDVAAEILRCLNNHNVSPMTLGLKDEIGAIGKRHSLHMLGLITDRDQSLARKDENIAQLQGELAALRYKLGHLELDLETEMKKAGK